MKPLEKHCCKGQVLNEFEYHCEVVSGCKFLGIDLAGEKLGFASMSNDEHLLTLLGARQDILIMC